MEAKAQNYCVCNHYIKYSLLLVECEAQFSLDWFTNMDNCISKSTFIDNLHADPQIYITKYSLLIVFVIFGMIKKNLV